MSSVGVSTGQRTVYGLRRASLGGYELWFFMTTAAAAAGRGGGGGGAHTAETTHFRIGLQHQQLQLHSVFPQKTGGLCPPGALFHNLTQQENRKLEIRRDSFSFEPEILSLTSVTSDLCDFSVSMLVQLSVYNNIIQTLWSLA